MTSKFFSRTRRKIAHGLRALSMRYSLFEEKSDLEANGVRFPADTGRAIWKDPGEISDFIDLSVFFDRDEEITLIDVGANVGKFTKDFLRHFPQTEVHAFEPVKDTFSRLRSAVGDRASCYQLALSNASGEQRIWIDTDSTLNSLETYTKSANLAYEKEYAEQEVIKTARLDDVNLPLRDSVMLKVDVQGHEVAMLEGAVETLKRVSVVLAELTFAPEYEGKEPSFSACCHILHQAGLYPIIFQVYGRSISNYGFERDVIFVRQPLLERIWRAPKPA